MSRIVWNKAGERQFETGIRNGVLYPRAVDGLYPLGVGWNGLISVTESPSGAEPTRLYADDINYVTLTSAEEFACTIEAFMHPPEFYPCDGQAEVAPGVYVSQQTRQGFGLSYRTTIGNDIEGNAFGYKLRLVYGLVASPTDRPNTTINDAPEAVTLSWEATSTPVELPTGKPTATLTIISTKADKIKMKALEDILYGTGDGETGIPPRLPLPKEVIELLGIEAIVPEG